MQYAILSIGCINVLIVYLVGSQCDGQSAGTGRGTGGQGFSTDGEVAEGGCGIAGTARVERRASTTHDRRGWFKCVRLRLT
jgi:hypothetical protein